MSVSYSIAHEPFLTRSSPPFTYLHTFPLLPRHVHVEPVEGVRACRGKGWGVSAARLGVVERVSSSTIIVLVLFTQKSSTLGCFVIPCCSSVACFVFGRRQRQSTLRIASSLRRFGRHQPFFIGKPRPLARVRVTYLLSSNRYPPDPFVLLFFPFYPFTPLPVFFPHLTSLLILPLFPPLVDHLLPLILCLIIA